MAKKHTEKPVNPKAAAKRKDPIVEVTLLLKHSVNGKSFGPGTVFVPASLAQMFLCTEDRAIEKERSLVQQRAYIIQVGRHGATKREVPYAKFDQILANSEIPIGDMRSPEGMNR